MSNLGGEDMTAGCGRIAGAGMRVGEPAKSGGGGPGILGDDDDETSGGGILSESCGDEGWRGTSAGGGLLPRSVSGGGPPAKGGEETVLLTELVLLDEMLLLTGDMARGERGGLAAIGLEVARARVGGGSGLDNGDGSEGRRGEMG